MISILFSYDFWVVAAGTSLLALAGSIVGCFSVYQGQSLVGDAIGHSAYPGVVLAFICFQTRDPLILTIGAALSGGMAYFLIHSLRDGGGIDFDSALALVLTGMFGLGMVLKTYTQGNPAYADASQAGLKNYIFGSAAFLMKRDAALIFCSGALVLSLLFLFRRILLISIFDRGYAKAIGIPEALGTAALLFMMIVLISVGLKSVGAVLISSFLLLPCICANQHSRSLGPILLLSALTGILSALFGTFLSTAYRGLSTGPMIILCMGSVTLLSMIFGRYGLLPRMLRKRGKEND